jgi:hypothetical protein
MLHLKCAPSRDALTEAREVMARRRGGCQWLRSVAPSRPNWRMSNAATMPIINATMIDRKSQASALIRAAMSADLHRQSG